MRNWDYGSNAPYFITICTAHRECFFGSIENHEMKLSAIGEIVVGEWLKTPDIRPDMNIFLDVFVLMPNHFHGIISIGKNTYNNRTFENNYNHDGGRDAMPGVSELEPSSNAIGDARHGVSTKRHNMGK
jgi:putative transposase